MIPKDEHENVFDRVRTILHDMSSSTCTDGLALQMTGSYAGGEMGRANRRELDVS